MNIKLPKGFENARVVDQELLADYGEDELVIPLCEEGWCVYNTGDDFIILGREA